MPSPEIKEDQSIKGRKDEKRKTQGTEYYRDMQDISFKKGLVNNVSTIAIIQLLLMLTKSRTSNVKLVFSENFSSTDSNFHLLHPLKINKTSEVWITHLVERVAVLYAFFSFIKSLNHYGHVLNTKHQARC